MLEAENFEVVEAPDGLQALAILEGGGIDAIISDILMPHMDGYRLCQEVRKSERCRNMPFIFYTATYTSPGDEKLCYDLGGDKYLRKPATRDVLLAALCEAMKCFQGTAASPRRIGVRNRRHEGIQRAAGVQAGTEEPGVAKGTSWIGRGQSEFGRARAAAHGGTRSGQPHGIEAFAHSVSHDLRAPLRHIGGYIDIIMRNCAGQLDETNLKHIQTVRGAAVTMGELIDALLDLSRVTRAEIQRRPVDLSALAAKVFAELQESDPSRVVKMEITPGLIANGDERLLRIVLVNLLGNAWKYSRKRPDARIEFGKIAGEAGETYFVRDNGAGFDMAYVGKLFGAFQRLHSGADFEGIGIGLATVKRIIQRHNGKIRAESINHQGATFYFTLGEGDPKPAAAFPS